MLGLVICVMSHLQFFSASFPLPIDTHAKHSMGRMLGEGASARVYRVTDRKTKAEFAAKIMRLNDESSLGDMAASLEHEMAVLRQVQHDNIVTYFGCCRRLNDVWILMGA